MGSDWGARASRVLAIASSRSRTFAITAYPGAFVIEEEVRFGETPKPTRETRALPGSRGERE